MLSEQDKRRYARHLLIPELGEAGQEKLMAARVLVIGAGGLGAAALSYLAAAGVGTLGIVDDDSVELSNLNRQIIHETGDIGRAKVQSAADRISELNPQTQMRTYQTRFTEANAREILEAYDLLVDGCDTFETRYVINHACRALGVPWVYGAVRGMEGQLSCFTPAPDAPCYRCFVPDAPTGRNDCAQRGVLGALVGVIGSMQAVEAIKLLTGMGTPCTGRLLRYNAGTAQWKEAHLSRDPECRECGNNTVIF